MKKAYKSPEVDIDLLRYEQNILSNGENLNKRTYGDEEGEDVENFWV